MDEQKYTRIILQSSRSTTFFSEEEAAESCQMEVQTLRRFQSVGLIQGVEISGEERRYSEQDIAQLRRIRRLHRDLGVNLAGIEIILRLSARLEALQRELGQ